MVYNVDYTGCIKKVIVLWGVPGCSLSKDRALVRKFHSSKGRAVAFECLIKIRRNQVKVVGQNRC